jgi:hypothetical protein
MPAFPIADFIFMFALVMGSWFENPNRRFGALILALVALYAIVRFHL